MTPEIFSERINSFLSEISLNAAMTIYFEKAGIYPSVLFCSIDNLLIGYELIPRVNHRLIVIPVPDGPGDMWMLSGKAGIIYFLGY